MLTLPVWAVTSLTLARLSVRRSRTSGDVAILYSYFEKDSTQKENFAFFITHGIGSSQQYPLLRNTEIVVVSGYMCSPCSSLPIYNEQHRCCIIPRDHLQVKLMHMPLEKQPAPFSTRTALCMHIIK